MLRTASETRKRWKGGSYLASSRGRSRWIEGRWGDPRPSTNHDSSLKLGCQWGRCRGDLVRDSPCTLSPRNHPHEVERWKLTFLRSHARDNALPSIEPIESAEIPSSDRFFLFSSLLKIRFDRFPIFRGCSNYAHLLHFYKKQLKKKEKWYERAKRGPANRLVVPSLSFSVFNYRWSSIERIKERERTMPIIWCLSRSPYFRIIEPWRIE